MIIFTNHAKKRMRERKILKSQIIAAIENPESAESQENDLKILRRKFGDKILELVIESGKNKVIVVTLYWL
ncbi:hypothetical protein A2W54_03325 [Candidatus Giovannonibacteria bacterium RIFCSPHIGHO2_02_43_13]|uniref:DUF4258 domain-containing protein n=1 Tax=Candidatus Giovannonibacteria bacterium RIFCSPHIGHO2_02_43_13 TaxID=1798330 RepID=A0A1F5WQ83_9BACT|nr:MAG: hypothetical protein UW28_C0004G0009 [Parcubacteria group bacterium GW2011_GWA2_44_13]OGF73918.1 MAG: hypothetical protein A3E06_00535 [Candidatus Giovannonibacteria bacterium RIFCSPHIGHO2_12_FULL_44_42]OGF77809.1 MAG: hypothetical protein A2W54_03325 [Candidatus Giovannonibacteria bacterium RIFCSPHIGHO2_02_43_13]OGF88856.1 MAG: hypothetical protein A3I94_02530 [Candidatus Giovannonibacteria bacterium RIFCSPLOWO2_02_FULL_43_54]OGF96820.1 MAG: hypothetical protein A3H08_01420 [Candidatus